MDIVEVSPKCLFTHMHVEYILTCDIGGTHCRFGVVGVNNDGTCDVLAHYIHHTHLISNEQMFVDILNTFLKNLYDSYGICISSCAIAAGGPVHNNTVTLVNHNLTISGDFIKTHTMLKDILILNDLVAIAYGVYHERKLAKTITPHVRLQEDGPFLVVAPGTGLGQATIHIQDNQLIVLPMESGHMDFIAYDSFDVDFMKFIKCHKHNESPVEFEDVISGRGICNIFRYLVSLETDIESVDVVHANLLLQYDTMIIPMLLSRYVPTNDICKKTFEYFYKYLARYCKNICLTDMTTGGLFIGGGMIEHNEETLNADSFLTEFIEHSNTRFSEVLAQIPIFMLSDSYLGVKGAARALLKKKA